MHNPHAPRLGSPISGQVALCSARKLLTDAAPAPAMAANDELTRMGAEIEELRDKVDELQDVIRDLQRRRRSPSPSPPSSDDDSSSLSSSSSDGASRKRRRRRRSRSMSAASLAEAQEKRARRRDMIEMESDDRIRQAKYMTAVSRARRRRDAGLRDAELQRALEGIEYCHICRASPCRCGRGGGHHRCPEANRDGEAARISAEAEVLEAQLRKQRAADALSDYLASRPKRARVAEIEDAAASD